MRLRVAQFWVLSIFISGIASAWAHQDDVEFARSPAATGKDRVQTAIEILQRVPSGKELVEKALVTWKLSSVSDLPKVIKTGPVSRTDAVLTRHYDAETGVESREREQTIFLNGNQSLTNIVLDLAHEMVHANSRPSWDPYDPNLTPGQYIKSAIDGVGGEVQAVAMECKVALELSKNYQIPLRRCKNYISSDQHSVLIDPIRKDFYRVGKWTEELKRVLGPEISELSNLSADSPELYSSTGNAPYPVALFREYEALTQIACDNSKKRIQSSSASAGRNLASGSNANLTKLFLERRCR